MKRIVLLVLLALAIIPSSAQSISSLQANQHVGEYSTVCGTVVGKHFAAQAHGQPTFIDFEQRYPRQPFTAVVWRSDLVQVGQLPEKGSVCVSGTIELYHGRPEIVLHNASDWQRSSGTLSNARHYINSDGQSVHSPAYSSSGIPPGATAQCADSTYSFSQHRQGSCSHHGGVVKWF